MIRTLDYVRIEDLCKARFHCPSSPLIVPLGGASLYRALPLAAEDRAPLTDPKEAFGNRVIELTHRKPPTPKDRIEDGPASIQRITLPPWKVLSPAILFLSKKRNGGALPLQSKISVGVMSVANFRGVHTN
jgi:hypothetical protein